MQVRLVSEARLETTLQNTNTAKTAYFFWQFCFGLAIHTVVVVVVVLVVLVVLVVVVMIELECLIF